MARRAHEQDALVGCFGGLKRTTADPGARHGDRKRQNEERLLMGAGWRDDDLVFCKVDGEPLNPDHFSREFVRRVARRELPHLSFDGLPHTWATSALEAGVHPKVVQERLGHSTISVTLDLSSHVTALRPWTCAQPVMPGRTS